MRMNYWLLIALLLFSSTASAEFPQRKSGLWQVESSIEGHSGSQVIKQCIDATTDEKMAKLARRMNKRPGIDCIKDERRKEGEQYITETDCSSQGVRIRSMTVLSGDFDNKYTGYTKTRYNPAVRGTSNIKVNIEAVWLGKCESWQKPGDMQMPDGSVSNVDELLSKTKAQ